MMVAEITRMLGLELEENSDYVDWVHLCMRASGIFKQRKCRFT